MDKPFVQSVAMEARRVGHFLDARRAQQCVEVARALVAHPNLWQHFQRDIEAVFAFVKEKSATGGRKRKFVSASKLYGVDCRGDCCIQGAVNVEAINLPLL